MKINAFFAEMFNSAFSADPTAKRKVVTPDDVLKKKAIVTLKEIAEKYHTYFYHQVDSCGSVYEAKQHWYGELCALRHNDAMNELAKLDPNTSKRRL